MRVTAITRLKHAALLEAARAFGGVHRLALHLGVHNRTVYQWIAMTSLPPQGINKRAWPPERLARLENDLLQVTGQTMEQLFPGAYRDAVVAGIPRVQEETREVEQSMLLEYARETSRRLEYQDPGEAIDRSQILTACRKRLTLMESRVIAMRYDHGMTLKECAKELQVSREWVRQKEARALIRMQNAIESGSYACQHAQKRLTE